MPEVPEMSPGERAAAAVLGVEAVLSLLLAALVDNGLMPRATLEKMGPTARRALAGKLMYRPSDPASAALIEEEAARSIERILDHAAKIQFGRRREH